MQLADVAILAGLTVPKWAELIVPFRFEIFFLIELLLPLVIAAVPLMLGAWRGDFFMRTQPMEDIDAVLGRFQAWSGSRNAAETKPGIRELSYEEALQSSRYRWQGGDKKQGAEQTSGRDADSAEISEPGPEGTKQAAAKGRHAKRVPAKNVRVGSRGAKTGQAVKSDAQAPPSMKSAIAPPSKTGAKASFREVLAETVQPAEVIVASRAVELTRQVTISIRLAPAERALIKTRAAEAGVSASAYIRQCALEVEQLRAQVQQAIPAMEGKPSAPAVQESVPTSGFLSRFARKLFAGSAPTLALRA